MLLAFFLFFLFFSFYGLGAKLQYTVFNYVV